MKTDDLIAMLAAAPPARRRHPLARMLPPLGLAAASSLAILLPTLGMRPDLAVKLHAPEVLFKFAFAVACFVAGASALRIVLRPEAARSLLPELGMAGFVLAAGIGSELALTASAHWSDAATGQSPALCLAIIVALSVVPAATALGCMRAGAPRRPALAGAVAGLIGSSIGMGVFALYCPNDSALFVGIWYLAALIATTGVCAVAGGRLLAW